MSENLEARLCVLSVEMQTVSLLRHNAENDSAYQAAAREREVELEKEILLLHRLLGHDKTGAASSEAQVLFDS